ncbi:hypothetical protein [Crocinitomix algicola]|uniref:hypothetical protein n=1 Tax=Crocinitomix algicola TaxID=1740263 RepID=UPI00082DA1DF|nr:hypothetical protein [Crocinitomix algicola]
MGKLESSQVIFGILYATGAISLLVVSYMLFIKRFKRNKLKAVSEVKLNTSRYDSFSNKTQFLIELSDNMQVTLSLLNRNEELVGEIINEELLAGENVVDFDPTKFEEGNYYLSLKTKNSSILRKIRITKD